MAEEARARPEISEAAIKAAWGKFEVGLRTYPAATVAQTERLKFLPGLAGSFSEFRRVGGGVAGERAAQMEVAARGGAVTVVEVDTDRAVDFLQIELEKPEVVGDLNLAAILRQTLDQVLELRDGIGDYVGVARREGFNDKTENVRRWLGGRGRAGEIMRRVERGDGPDVSQIKGRRVRRVDVVESSILTKDVRQAVDVLGRAFVSLGRADWTPEDGEVKQIVDAVKVASVRLLPEQYDRVVTGFGIKLFREIGMAFMAVQERGRALTAEEKVRMGNYVKLFKNSFPMMEGVPVVKKFLLEIERKL